MKNLEAKSGGGRLFAWMTAGFLAMPVGVLAAEPAKEPAKTIDERVSDLEKSLGALADFGLSGMAYGSYLYNFNDPDSRTNTLRSLDQEDNSG